MKTKKIYIILTYTGTFLSRIISVYTGFEYSHISISLDKKLNKMYSFGRKKAYNPFIAGFVHEKLNKGTFKRFKNTKTEIYCIEITSEQYNTIRKQIKRMHSDKKLYRFNFIGLLLAGIHFKFTRKNYYYCAEFVKDLIDNASIDLNLPKVVRPMDFIKYNDLELIYKGILRDYREVI